MARWRFPVSYPERGPLELAKDVSRSDEAPTEDRCRFPSTVQDQHALDIQFVGAERARSRTQRLGHERRVQGNSELQLGYELHVPGAAVAEIWIG
jgi:hypothetical protein